MTTRALTGLVTGTFFPIAACGDRRSMNKTILLLLLFGVAIAATPSAQAALTCTAPCTTANVQISNGSADSTIAGFALASFPASTSDLAVVANYLVNMNACIVSGDKSSFSGVFTSTDQGSTWSGGCQPPSGAVLLEALDPVAIYDIGGNLFTGQLGTNGPTPGVFLQENQGSFFPTISFTNQTTVNFYNYDFPGLAIDSNNCLYVTAWETGDKISNHKPFSAVAVAHACSPDYTSWTTVPVFTPPIVAPNVAAYSRVAVGSDNTVFVTWVQESGGTAIEVYAATSPDKGNTWTADGSIFSIKQTAAAACPNNNPYPDRALPHTCVRMFYFPQLASSAGPQYNAVYPNHNGTQIQINYRSSAKWSSDVVLDAPPADPTATGDQFEPCIASPSASSSTIGVAWLDTRNSPKGKPDSLYDAYAMISSDGGATWSTAYRLSTQSSGTTVAAVPNSEYLGDWTGCAWQNGIFYYAFPSTANGTHQVGMIAGLNLAPVP
jgi:hypothetical protein